MHIDPVVRKKILIGIGAAVLTLVGLGIYSSVRLYRDNITLAARLASTQSELVSVQERNNALLGELGYATETLDSFSSKIDTLTSTVGTLEKFKNTDPELLRKYSKVFFLNENYMPKGLADIESQYLYPAKKSLLFLSQAYPFLKNMLDAANAEGLQLQVISAYRSFDQQSDLKSSYKVTYGSGANTFSADQGYSEHQLGTTVDLTTPKVGATFSGFSKTPEYAWLMANAYKYGFILSYPPNNSYYIYEPWHWRFVGVALATRLHEEKENFYNLTERQIDPYIVTIFDQH